MAKNSSLNQIQSQMTELVETLAVSAVRAIKNGDNGCHDGGRVEFVNRVVTSINLAPKEWLGPEAQDFLAKYSGGAYGPNALPQVSWREQNPQFFKDDAQASS